MMPQFEDYHRTVIGYHGTKRSTALQVVQGLEKLKQSEKSDDWLGSGVYYWEYGPRRAWEWAVRRKEQSISAGTWDQHDDVAVLASMIRLGNCFDLLDAANVKFLKEQHFAYVTAQQLLGKPVPKNAHTHRYLDRAVFEFTYASAEEEPAGIAVDTCRAVYIPRDNQNRIWKGSWISEEAHIQLCVRNPKCILGTWMIPLL